MDPNEETPLHHDHLGEMSFTRGDAPSPFIDEEQPALLAPLSQENGISCGALDGALDEPTGLRLNNKPASMRTEKAKKAKVAPKRSWLRVDSSGEATVVQADKNKLVRGGWAQGCALGWAGHRAGQGAAA
jgi:hypothetical protein